MIEGTWYADSDENYRNLGRRSRMQSYECSSKCKAAHVIAERLGMWALQCIQERSWAFQYVKYA